MLSSIIYPLQNQLLFSWGSVFPLRTFVCSYLREWPPTVEVLFLLLGRTESERVYVYHSAWKIPGFARESFHLKNTFNKTMFFILLIQRWSFTLSADLRRCQCLIMLKEMHVCIRKTLKYTTIINFKCADYKLTLIIILFHFFGNIKRFCTKRGFVGHDC